MLSWPWWMAGADTFPTDQSAPALPGSEHQDPAGGMCVSG